MQLLQITVTPMKYELQIEHAKLEYQQDMIPSAQVRSTPSELRIQTRDAAVRLDTYQARRSLGFANVADRIRAAADKGQASIAQYTRGTVEEGAQMARIEDGMTIGQIIRQKMLEQPETFTAFLPSGGADISWEPNQIEMDYEKGKVNYDWQIKSNVMSYVPGSVRMQIIQYGKVEVEYLGTPMYIPPSSDPHYEEPSAG